jgi:predicted SAM-dependent methyltransferase
MKMLNLGCGTRYHKDWINVDFVSNSPSVMAYNLIKGIPFEDNSFDVVYHSNVIEHFSKEDAPKFLAECYRVLKPTGILRVAYPDLEEIVKQYLLKLQELKDNNYELKDDYEWIMLELFDQTVRNYSGGDMMKYFIKENIPNEKYVLSRCGVEVQKLIEYGKKIVKQQNDGSVYKPDSTYIEGVK